jgi:hypothetical protein
MSILMTTIEKEYTSLNQERPHQPQSREQYQERDYDDPKK